MKRRNKKDRNRIIKVTKVQKPLTVSDALSELKNLNKANSTGTYSPSVTSSLVDERVEEKIKLPPSSEQLSDITETGFGLEIEPEKDESLKASFGENGIKLDTLIKNEIASIKSKSQNTSISISLGIGALVASILIAILLYFHGDLNSEVNSLEKKISNFITTIETKITSLKSRITKVENTYEIKQSKVNPEPQKKTP